MSQNKIKSKINKIKEIKEIKELNEINEEKIINNQNIDIQKQEPLILN